MKKDKEILFGIDDRFAVIGGSNHGRIIRPTKIIDTCDRVVFENDAGVVLKGKKGV